jgi:gas vesicle protein
MRYLVSFLSGVFVGAVAALLFAPMSGEELRTQIQEGAAAELERAQGEWNRAVAELSERFEETSQEIRSAIEQATAQQEPEAEG